MKSADKWKSKTIQKIERLKNWSKTRKFRCETCRSETPPSLELSDGRHCLPCIAKRLKDNLLLSVDIQEWTLIQFAEFLKKGSAIERLIVLWRFEEVMSIVGRKDGTKVFQLYQALAKNLGYIHQIPLASYVRQAAHEAAVLVGESILSILVCTKEGVPAVQYANAVLTAATISHDHVEVQRMLKKAVKHNNAGIKKILLNAFQELDEPWIPPLLEMMLTDPNPTVKSRANNIYDQKVEIKLDSSENKKVRKVKLSPEFLNQIHSTYTLDTLKMIYDEYLIHFFDIKYFGMLNHMIKGKLKKNDLAHALAVLFFDQDNFNLFMDSLHEDVYTVFERLVWEGGELSCSVLNVSLSEKVSSIKEENRDGRIYSKNVFNPKYSIFVTRKAHNISPDGGWVNYYYISLPHFLRNHFRKFFPKPEYYNLIPIKKEPKKCQIFSEKDTILFQLHLIWSYVFEDNLMFTSKSMIPTNKSLNDMILNCSINEFYPSAKFEEKYIRTILLACFFDALSGLEIDNTLSPEKLLKQMINYFLEGNSGKLINFSAFHFLTYLKGWEKVTGQYHAEYHYFLEAEFRKNLCNVLKKLPVDKWISFDNIAKYFFYRDISLEIVHIFVAGQYIYFQPCIFINNEWIPLNGKKYISEANYTQAITEPSLKMYLFLFASLGILDVAYKNPQNDVLRIKKRPYFTVYDGLQYVRLTDLGAYILGKTETYEFDKSKISAEVILDEDRLIANIKGKDPIKQMVIDKIADMIHDDCYRVNYKTFLKGCRSTKEIDHKIEMFYKYISKEPPPIWQSFIDEITAKKDPLTEKENMRVFKVKENKELIDLIARDEKLRKYVLISEDYHILIENLNVPLVQRRLETFGFFVDM